LNKGVEYLVEASAAEAEAITAALAAAKARQANGNVELPSRDHGVEATSIEKQVYPLIMLPNSARLNSIAAAGGQLHQ